MHGLTMLRCFVALTCIIRLKSRTRMGNHNKEGSIAHTHSLKTKVSLLHSSALLCRRTPEVPKYLLGSE